MYGALTPHTTQDELHRFFAVIPSPRDRALFAVIYHYSLREGTSRATERVSREKREGRLSCGEATAA